MSSKTTIKDIALETGLSITAISLVLNNRPNKISESSRRLILDTAKRLHYRSNQLAPGSYSRQSKNIGQIIPDVSNYFFSKLVQGADSMAYANKYSLILATTNNDPKRELDAIRSLYARGVDGILMTTSMGIDVKEYDALFRSLNVPIVLIDRVIPALSCSSLTYNHKKGSYLATRHLLELGHRRIACLTGGSANYASIPERTSGYLWAFEEFGVKPPEDGIIVGDYTDKSGYCAADAVVSGRFTAVFCCNDMMAYGLYKRLRQLNVRIPDDLSVVGFDDVEFSDLIDPPLTTVRQSSYTLGCEAALRLFMEIKDRTLPNRSIFFEPILIQRASTRAL